MNQPPVEFTIVCQSDADASSDLADSVSAEIAFADTIDNKEYD